MVRVSPDGKQLPDHDFGGRGWGSVVFGHDGSIYLCEYLKGTRPYQGGMMRLLEGGGPEGTAGLEPDPGASDGGHPDHHR